MQGWYQKGSEELGVRSRGGAGCKVQAQESEDRDK